MTWYVHYGTSIAMKTRIAKWLGYGKAPVAAPESRPGDNPVTLQDTSENGMRRQLVQMLMRKLTHSNGIPAHWIECQMLLASSRSRGQGMYIRLVLKHFDTRFMAYAFAFQQTLRKDIERFEPKSAEWLHGLSWQFDMADSCPHHVLPDKAFWQVAAPSASLPTSLPSSLPLPPTAPPPGASKKSDQLFYPVPPPTVDERTEDIERLFAIRDRELASSVAHDITPVGYEATQPSALRM